MFTINQVEALIESVNLVFVLGFVFCMIQMVTNYSFRKKALTTNNANSERYLALRKQLIVGLGFLFLCFFVALMVMDFLHNWNGSSSSAYINSDPRLMREAINKVVESVKLIVILCFVGIGTKLVLSYREQVAKLNSN